MLGVQIVGAVIAFAMALRPDKAQPDRANPPPPGLEEPELVGASGLCEPRPSSVTLIGVVESSDHRQFQPAGQRTPMSSPRLASASTGRASFLEQAELRRLAALDADGRLIWLVRRGVDLGDRLV